PEIVAGRDLEIVRRVGDDLHGEARALAQLRVVGGRGIAVREPGVRSLDHGSREPLRRLRPPEPVSWYGFRDTLLLDVFDSIGNGYRRHGADRSEEHTSELQSRFDLVCRLLLEK